MSAGLWVTHGWPIVGGAGQKLEWSIGQKFRVRVHVPVGSSLERCGQLPRAVAGSLSMSVKLGDRTANSATRTVIRT